MAALIAGVARHRALLHRLQGSSQAAARRHAAWRGPAAMTSLPAITFPSFSTGPTTKKPRVVARKNPVADRGDAAQAVAGVTSAAATGNGDGKATPTPPPSQQRAPLSAEDIRKLHKKWITPSATTKVDHKLVLRAVYDCYKPLYASHPLLIGKKCALPIARGARSAFKPLEYDDFVTKQTETYALESLVKSQNFRPAFEVMNHRQWVASTVGSLALADGTRVDLSRHLPEYLSWEMQANAHRHMYMQVQTLYENALAQGVSTTPTMDLLYVDALLTDKKFSAALALYTNLHQLKHPLARDFYTAILKATAATLNSTVATQVIQEMESKGVAMTAIECEHAIRSLDGEFVLDRSNSSKQDGHHRHRRRSLFSEMYEQCVKQIAEQDAQPDKYVSVLKASRHVVDLFDGLVATSLPEQPQQSPPHALFVRVVGAAMYLQEYDAVGKYMALYERTFGKPAMDPPLVSLATNALLLQKKPVVAWDYALKIAAIARSDPLLSESDAAECNRVGLVLEYLKLHQETALLKQLLVSLGGQALLDVALSKRTREYALRAITNDTNATSDLELWQFMADYAHAFPVLANSRWLTHFTRQCVAAGRWSLVVKAIQARDPSQKPTLYPVLGAYVARKVVEEKNEANASRELLQLVAQLPDMVNSGDFKESELKVQFASDVIRAMDALQRQESQESSASQMPEQQQQQPFDIGRVHELYLRDEPIDAIPEDVREIVRCSA